MLNIIYLIWYSPTLFENLKIEEKSCLYYYII